MEKRKKNILRNAGAMASTDLISQSARKFKFDLLARWLNNNEIDQKKADDAYFFRDYLLRTCVS